MNGLIAPSAIESRPFGITSSGSTSSRLPRPVHTGQAPWGELKLNVLGSRSGIDISGWSIHAYYRLYNVSVSLSASTIKILPDAISSVCSID